jgi:hypothetical protein
MRTRLAILVAVALSTTLVVPAAQAGSRAPTRPERSGKIRTASSGNTVRYSRSRAGIVKKTPAVRVAQPAVRCNRWTTTETVGEGEEAKVIVHSWRQCFSVASGRPTGPPREIPGDSGGTGPGEDVWTAVVPDPVILRENSARFVTQRLSWVWLPPEYFRGIPVLLRSTSGATATGAATARAIDVSLHPGWGGTGNAIDCTTDAQFPYDRAKGYWEQRSCGLLYMKSSIHEPGGTYTATATVTWVVNATIDGEPADPAVVVTDGQATFRVEELQALVTCVGGNETACPSSGSSGSSPTRR